MWNLAYLLCSFVVVSSLIPHSNGECTSALCTEVENVTEKVGNALEDAFEDVKKEGKIIIEDVEDLFRQNSQECQCLSYNCGCCAHLEEPVIELNSTICANVSYLAQDYGISVTITVNQYCIFNETISARNPPPICLGVPYVKEWAEACVRFYNVDATKSHLHACVRVEARMKMVVVAKFELGCFDIGPRLTTQDYEHRNPFVVMV